jgi:hypothetical protein
MQSYQRRAGALHLWESQRRKKNIWGTLSQNFWRKIGSHLPNRIDEVRPKNHSVEERK